MQCLAPIRLLCLATKVKGGDNGRIFFKLPLEEATAQWPMLLSNFNLTLIL